MKPKYLLICIFFIAVSCKKNNTQVPIQIIPPDTLTAGWTKVNISTADYFSDIFFIDNDTGYVSGSQGIYKSTNGGQAWQKISGKAGDFNLAVTADGKVFALSSNDTLYRSYNGGVSFDAVKVHSTGQAFDVFFTGKDTGYIPAAGDLKRTTDGGHTWESISPLTGLNLSTSTRDIPFFINNTTGWISGNGTSGVHLYKMNGSINNWVECTFDVSPQNTSTNFLTIFANSLNAVYVGTSQGRIYKSVDGGTHFSLIATLETPVGGYPDIHFTDDNNGYVALGYRLYHTTDGGITWNKVVSLGAELLVEIHFTDANHGWACGSNGCILRFKP